MYEPVLVDEKSDLYNVYEVHKNYRILAMAVIEADDVLWQWNIYYNLRS